MTGASASADAAASAVGRARAAAALWGRLTPAERRPYLLALRRAVAAGAERVAAVVGGETGKLAADVVQAEVLHAATHAAWCARHAPAALAPARRSSWPLPARRAWVEYVPLGVAAVISPWNYPFLLPFLATASALAAGCTVVVKPSEVAPRSGALVEELAAAAGLPDGAVVTLPGGGETGAALVRAGVDVVSVTGSPATGRKVAALAAERLIPTVLELGGKDPLLVLDDADLRRAARAAVWGACFNAGQSCVAVERVIVVEAVAERFEAELARAFDAVGAGGDPRRDVGPILHPPQVAVIAAQVREAVAAGAVLRRGGATVPARDGRERFEPTLLTGVRPEMAVLREETFGPVLPVLRVADEAAAVAAANDSPFGLHASVWTADRTRGRRVASQLRAGAVAVNDCLVNYALPALPFGGVGDSGYGRQGGPEGLRAYCFTRSVTEPRLPPLPREPQWFPRLGGAPLWARVTRVLHGR